MASVFAIVGTIPAAYAIARFGPMVVNRLSSRRFGECYHTIDQCCDNAKECTQTDDMNDPSQLELYAAVSEISETLRRFGMQCPSANQDDGKYTVFPSVVVSTARQDGRTYAAAWFEFLNQFSLTSKGSQRIRKDSLWQIFSSLKPDFYGDHLIPTMVKILRKQIRPARMNSAITLPILI